MPKMGLGEMGLGELELGKMGGHHGHHLRRAVATTCVSE